MSALLFDILIYPIVFILELVFALVYQMIGSVGYSIIAVSIIVNIMVMPLYKRSDAMQEHERKEQERLAPVSKHIRKVFKGDERFMILQEYYRQNNYHTLYVLRGSLSMLLEVPFFIAAYYFLSHLTILQGASFHMIKDLGAPDSLIRWNNLSINVLPILMTVINFISGAIYTKGFQLRDKLQLYTLAVLFLVLLYNSPSGLVIYWTMNNAFSLIKNIFVKLSKDSKRDSAVLIAFMGILFLGAMYLRGKLYEKQILLFSLAVSAICLVPLLRWLTSHSHKSGSDKLTIDAGKDCRAYHNLNRDTYAVFILSGLFLTTLLGVVIPSSIVASSPADFISMFNGDNPLQLVVQIASIFFGLFSVWCGVVFFLVNDQIRQRFALAFWVLVIVSSVNYLVFAVNGGVLSTDLVYGGFGPARLEMILINGAVLLLSTFVSILLFKRFYALIKHIVLIALIALIGISIRNIILTNISRDSELLTDKEIASIPEDGLIHLSRTGKNVVVLMLDRAVSGYIPYIFNEDPGLNAQYKGFTYYPNTVSYAMHTNMGAPALYGGYEYTPKAMNERKGMTLAQKHNEALKVLPKLFTDNGFEVTVCDTSYAGYTEVGDYSIYSEMPGVRAIHLRGAVRPDNYRDIISIHQQYRKHSYLMYSIMCASPVSLRWWLYDMGCYRGVRRYTDGSPSEDMIGDYTELAKLPDLTTIKDDVNNCMFFMVSYLTHDPEPLQLPDYSLEKAIDNSPYINGWMAQFDESHIRMKEESVSGFRSHYQCNAAAIHLLGNWFDSLREEDVFDNTRIILVADHGANLEQFPELVFGQELDAQGLNPLLMVKDFNANSEFRTDNTFMTNADVPSLALERIIAAPRNPFTGRSIDQLPKKELQYVTTSHHYTIDPGPVEEFDTSDGNWFTVHSNLFDESNWNKVGDEQ